MQTDIQKLGELSSDGVFVYDYRAELFIYFNKAFSEIFRVDAADLEKDPTILVKLIETEDSDYLRNKYEELREKRFIKNTEFRINLADNVCKYICCDTYIIQESFLVTGFVKDVTKEKEHENYIMNYGAKKDTLLDMLTHNLSGPLHLTTNILRWMQMTYKDQVPGDISSQLQIIESNTQHCLDIVNDFLKEEHLESEKIFVKKTRFDLIERISATLEKLIATNKDKKFRLVTKLDSLNISTDSVKFFQVIHNLVSNSIKFTPTQGEINMLVEETESTFLIHVKDNGIGIPKEMLSQLFVKKTPAGRTGLNNEFSTGMGLSIVKSLTELMGGSVQVASEENKGTTFTLELPKS